MRGMKALVLLAMFAGPCAAETAQPGPAAWTEAAPGGFWMRRYTERRYGAFWHLELSTGDFAKARARVEKILVKRRGSSAVPASSQVGSEKVQYLQWSYVFSRADAAKAADELKKAGKPLRESRQENLGSGEQEEVSVNLARLKAERASAGTLFERLPATAAAVAEVAEHLERVLASWEDSQDKVLLNLSLQQELP